MWRQLYGAVGALTASAVGLGVALELSVGATAGELHPPHYRWSHSGFLESFDHASLRRGYQVSLDWTLESHNFLKARLLLQKKKTLRSWLNLTLLGFILYAVLLKCFIQSQPFIIIIIIIMCLGEDSVLLCWAWPHRTACPSNDRIVDFITVFPDVCKKLINLLFSC